MPWSSRHRERQRRSLSLSGRPRTGSVLAGLGHPAASSCGTTAQHVRRRRGGRGGISSPCGVGGVVEKISVAPAHKLSLWVCLQMRVNRTLTALVAASLVGSAQTYSCTSDAQCKYQGCSNGLCVSGTKPKNTTYMHACARVVAVHRRVCMCEGRVERGGERRHALTCLASVRARAGAVHRLVLTFAADRGGAAWLWRLGCAGACRATLLSTLGSKYREGGCDVCAGCEGRVERGGERRHALTCLASVRARAGAVHRLVLTFAVFQKFTYLHVYCFRLYLFSVV